MVMRGLYYALQRFCSDSKVRHRAGVAAMIIARQQRPKPNGSGRGVSLRRALNWHESIVNHFSVVVRRIGSKFR
jgi:hypothetical protein